MHRFCAAIVLAGIAAAALSRRSRKTAAFVATLSPDELALFNLPCSRTLH